MSCNLQAYSLKFSYFPGELLEVKLNFNFKIIHVSILNFCYLNEVINITVVGDFKQKNLNCWITNYIIKLPSDIAPGLYFMKFYYKTYEYYFPFIIKNNNNNSRNNLLVLMNTNTWHARDTTFSKKITYDKPLILINNNIKFYIKNNIIENEDKLLYGELKILKWFAYCNYGFDLITDIDLHNMYDISTYKIFVISCFPEYWSNNMITNVLNNANNIIYITYKLSHKMINIDNNILYTNGTNDNILKYFEKHKQQIYQKKIDKIVEYHNIDTACIQYFVTKTNNKRRLVFSTELNSCNNFYTIFEKIFKLYFNIFCKSKLSISHIDANINIKLKQENIKFKQKETINVILLVYKRIENFSKILNCLEKQTVSHRLYLHIINNNSKKANIYNDIIKKSNLKISIHNYNNKNNCFERFYYVKKLIEKHIHLNYVIFIDDDHYYDNDWIEKLYELRKPKCFITWYTKIFSKNKIDYFSSILNYNETCNNKNIKYTYAHYGGPGGSIIDINIFKYNDFFNLPDNKYKFMDDIWISYFLYKKKWKIKRSFLPPHLIKSNNSLHVAIYNKIKFEKNKTFMYLIKNNYWKLDYIDN